MNFIRLSVALAAIMCAAPALAQSTTAVVVPACGTPPTTYSAGQNRLLTQDTTGTLCLSTVTPATLAATSTPVIATINTTGTSIVGPFSPQLSRAIRLTLNATVSASGSVQVLRSIDGGTTKLAITRDGGSAGSYTLSAVSGVIANEPLPPETEAAATYYLSVTLTAGSVAVRMSQ